MVQVAIENRNHVGVRNTLHGADLTSEPAQRIVVGRRAVLERKLLTVRDTLDEEYRTHPARSQLTDHAIGCVDHRLWLVPVGHRILPLRDARAPRRPPPSAPSRYQL